MAHTLTELISEAERLIAGLNPTGIDCMDKYLDASFEVKRKMQLISELGLDHSATKPKKIFDISTGAGWLPWLLKHYGHEIEYTDNLREPNHINKLIRRELGLTDCRDFAYERVKKSKHEWQWKPIQIPDDTDIVFAMAVQPHSLFTPMQIKLVINNILSQIDPGGYFYFLINTGTGSESLDIVAENYINALKILKGWRFRK